jgi:hypothetical protein
MNSRVRTRRYSLSLTRKASGGCSPAGAGRLGGPLPRGRFGATPSSTVRVPCGGLARRDRKIY